MTGRQCVRFNADASCAQYGDTPGPPIGTPTVGPRHRERRPFYVYAPAPDRLVTRSREVRYRNDPQPTVRARPGVLGG